MPKGAHIYNTLINFIKVNALFLFTTLFRSYCNHLVCKEMNHSYFGQIFVASKINCQSCENSVVHFNFLKYFCFSQ